MTGKATETCAAFNMKMHDEPSGELREVVAWAHGYVSGRNVVDQTISNGYAVAGPTFDEDLAKFLISRCAAQPSFSLDSLILRFVVELPRQKVEGG